MITVPTWGGVGRNGCPLDLEGELDLAWSDLFDDISMRELEALSDLLASKANPPFSKRERVLLSAILQNDPERRGDSIAEPDIVEALLLEVVVHYRREGSSWSPDAQLMALRIDAWLRWVGAIRRRWATVCGLLGIELAEAMDGPVRRWWWPSEVPDVQTIGEGFKVRPVVYLPTWPGEIDRYGLGEGWEPGQLLIIGAGLVRDALPNRSPRLDPARSLSPARDDPRTSLAAAPAQQVDVEPSYVAVGLEHLEQFLEGR